MKVFILSLFLLFDFVRSRDLLSYLPIVKPMTEDQLLNLINQWKPYHSNQCQKIQQISGFHKMYGDNPSGLVIQSKSIIDIKFKGEVFILNENVGRCIC